MNLDEKLKQKKYKQVWQQYCGFLDLTMEEYMEIQTRLMREQIDLYANCELGRRIMHGTVPKTIEEYRQQVPLTRYEDYADILLSRQEELLLPNRSSGSKPPGKGGVIPSRRRPIPRA
jgi:phosphoserine phosphatase